MAQKAKHTCQTRERLLESAVQVFATKGFRGATVKDICEHARANIAAVNYHFGDKEALYAEAWRSAFERSLQEHPPDGGVPPDAPPEDRLRGRIKAMVHHVADADNPAFRIVHKEMANPTRLLTKVRHECVRPLMDAMKGVIVELLGPGAPQKCVHFCQASIAAQCFGLVRHIRRKARRRSSPHGPMQDVIRDIDGYAEHVADFSLAGIRATRQLLEAHRPDTRARHPRSANR